MSQKETSLIDAALFGKISRITIVEYQDKTTISIQQRGTGTVTYRLKDKKVYWKRDSVKITDASIGCLYQTNPPHCLKNPFIQRTLFGVFSNSYECLFKQIKVVGEHLVICEEMDRISFRHPLCPEYTELFTRLLKNVQGVECVEYQRNCVPRFQEGIITLVTTKYHIVAGIS